MARETIPFDRTRILFFETVPGSTLAVGQTLFSKLGATLDPVIDCHGHRRLVGNFHGSTTPAAGFPRIRLTASFDGTYDITLVLLQDVTQPEFQYPFDINLHFPGVSLEWTQGAAIGTLKVAADVFPE